MKLATLIVAALALSASAEMKVGIIGLDTSHAIAFTKLMNVEKSPAVAGFKVTHAYQWGSRDIVSSTNRYPQYIPQMQEMGVKIVPSIAELLKSVDCVCLETNDGREHYAQAKEVFASGKPCFIDKPLAHNLRDALKVYELGRKTGAKYFSSSALRFTPVAQAARQGKYGKIRTCSLISPSPLEEQGTHNFYSWYGIHGFEPLVTVMGMGAEKVSCFRNQSDDAINVTWRDGRMASLHLLRNGWVYSGYILPEKPADRKNPVVVYDGYSGYQSLLAEIVKFFRTGIAPIAPEETLEIFAMMEAAEMSAKKGGAPVTLAEALAACR